MERKALEQKLTGFFEELHMHPELSYEEYETTERIKRELAAAGIEILQDVGLRKNFVQYVSCPTCGRTCIDVGGIMRRVQEELKGVNVPFKVAVMGCVVNGPGEARAADVGIAGGDGEWLLFRHGEILYKVPQDKLVDALMDEIDKL